MNDTTGKENLLALKKKKKPKNSIYPKFFAVGYPFGCNSYFLQTKIDHLTTKPFTKRKKDLVYSMFQIHTDKMYYLLIIQV